jgi:hypothetical protein
MRPDKSTRVRRCKYDRQEKNLPLYIALRGKKKFTPKDIKAGFAASSLFPFSSDRVLRSKSALLAKSAILRVQDCHLNM